MSDYVYKSAAEFISKMDSGVFDGSLTAEVKKLSSEQLEQIALLLVERYPLPPTERPK